MMTNTADYVYTVIPKLEAFVLELPYGRENRLSMLVILPKRGNFNFFTIIYICHYILLDLLFRNWRS